MIILLSVVCVALVSVIIYQITVIKRRNSVILWLNSALKRPVPFDRILDKPYKLDYNKSLNAVSIFFYPKCPPNAMHLALHHIAFLYPSVKIVRFENFPSNKFYTNTFRGLHYDVLDFSKVTFDECEEYGIPLISSQVPCESLIMPLDTRYVDFSKFDKSLEELVLPGPYAPATNVPSYQIPIPRGFGLNVPACEIEKYKASSEWSKLYFCHPPITERVKITIRPIP